MNQVTRRSLLGGVAATTALAVLPGCRRDRPTSDRPFAGEELLVFNWSDYIDPELMDEFEEQTGARLVYDNYSSDSELETRLLTGGGDYDIVVPSDRSMPALLGKDALQPIDLALLPNLKCIDPKFLDTPFDPKNRFSVPYFWGTVAVGVRSDHVANPPLSFEPLFDPRNRDHITMLDDGEHAVAMALLHLSLPMNSVSDDDLAAAKRLLLEQRPLVRAYTSDSYKEKLITGEAWSSLGWSGDLRQAADEEPAIRVLVPQKGTTMWLDSLALCKGAKHSELAHRFINFLLEPEIAARNAQFVHYATPNQNALQLLPGSVRNDPTIYPPPAVLDRCGWLEDRGAAIAKVERIWREVRQ
jgi:spermidine/putrescine transport system substrate-binding protein